MRGAAARTDQPCSLAGATRWQNQVDREGRDRWRWLARHVGLPLGISVALHATLFVLMSLKTWDAWAARELEVGPYQASVLGQPEQPPQPLRWDEPVETPVLESRWHADGGPAADLRSLVEWREVSPSGGAPGNSTATGLGPAELAFGAGALSLLGTGSGAAAAGTGGLGDGLARGQRSFDVGLWDVRVPAERVVYVVDFSGSIVVAVDELKRELKRSVGRLRAGQSFNVIIFYGEGTGSQERCKVEAFAGQLQPATEQVRREFFNWLSSKAPRGGTEPLPAIQRALAMQPDVVFFFSDGYFDDAVVEEITRANRQRQTSIVCLVFDEILLQDSSNFPRETEGTRRMRRLAEQNRGQVKIVTGADLQP